jgi:ribonucleoside-diphosphate reductase alpha chain
MVDVVTFSYDEVKNFATEYFNGGALEASVWIDKYAMKDNDGRFHELTPHDMHKRLAREFARIDIEKYGMVGDREALYLDSMIQFERIVPQGSPMSAVGNHLRTMSASNCVVVESPHDSIGGIFKTATELAQLYKRRCGVGTDVSTLRPEDWSVNNAARKTTGPISFCDLYSEVTRRIGQDGRRGALMLTMSVHHPDDEKFAAMKADKKKVTGANVSVRLTDEFLEAVDKDQEYEQRWPCEEGVTPVFRRMVKARDVWNTIIKYATVCAEPGLIFWDRMTKRLPAHAYKRFKSTSTNPCSEICLSPYDSCRLISMNLTGYVRKPFTSEASFDFNAFCRDVALAVQMADNLVDIELELVDKILAKCEDQLERELWTKLREAGQRGRRVGLGTHGLADTMAQLGIKYDDFEALQFAHALGATLRDTAYHTSIDLAISRGPFPEFNWETEKDNEYIKSLPESIQSRMAIYGRRNIALLTNAPTGSVSLVSKTGPTFSRFQVSSGMEPVFKNSHIRRKKGNPGDHGFRVDRTDDMGDHWMEFTVHHNNIANWAEVTGGDLNNLPAMFVESENINWAARVKLQGVLQSYIDHSISSTINLPRGTSQETVGEIYLQAWKQGLKGVTVYVDGSRDGVLVDEKESAANKKVDTSVRPDRVVRMMAPKRPKELPCEIHQATVKGRKWYAIVGLLNGEPYEMFGGPFDTLDIPAKCKTGKIVRKSQGKYNLVFDNDCETVEDIISKVTYCDEGAQIGWITRLVSTALRHGTPIEFLVEQLNKEGNVTDLNKVLARVLKKYIAEGKKVLSSTRCPSCDGTEFVFQEGCPRCVNCAHTKCG